MSLVTALGAVSQETQEPQQEVPPLPPSTNPTNRAIFPGEGQTQEQQLGDQLECYRWATQQTGWDPYQAYDVLVQQGYAAQQSAEQAQGGLLKGAAGGAMMGLAIGAIAGDARKGAAIGATAGGLAGGARSRRAQQAAQQQADQATAAFEEKMKVWDRNYVACMQGHDYTVN
jgi:hypothetical protein